MIFGLTTISAKTFLTFSQINAGAVRRNPAARSATNAEIDSIIKDWLRYAKDRDGGRAKRAARQISLNPSQDLSQESTEDYGSSDEHD